MPKRKITQVDKNLIDAAISANTEPKQNKRKSGRLMLSLGGKNIRLWLTQTANCRHLVNISTLKQAAKHLKADLDPTQG